MIRNLRSIGLILLLLILTIGTALADSPNHDSFVRASQSGTNFDTQELSVSASTASCNTTDTTYMQWDVSGISGSVTVATLTLTATTTILNTGSAMISLYETTDSWTEGAITASNAPAVGSLIQTVNAPTTGGETITFNNAALVSYLDTQASGDDIASFALRFSSGCAAGVSIAVFEDKESGANGPDLTTTPPLAVTLANFGVTSQEDHVLVDWATVFEQDNLGFNVLRSTSPDGAQTRLNADLIPSQAPGSGQGAEYGFEDYDVEDETTYFYWLEDVSTSGATTRHGPVSVTYESNTTAVEVASLSTGASSWQGGLLGTVLLLAAAGCLWYWRRRAY